MLAAVLIIMASISLAAYLILSTDFSQVTITPGIIIIPVLFLVLVIGFVLMVFNKGDVKLTSDETDKKVGKKLNNIMLYMVVIFLLYTCWKLYNIA